jgi:hypothetical protein
MEKGLRRKILMNSQCTILLSNSHLRATTITLTICHLLVTTITIVVAAVEATITSSISQWEVIATHPWPKTLNQTSIQA